MQTFDLPKERPESFCSSSVGAHIGIHAYEVSVYTAYMSSRTVSRHSHISLVGVYVSLAVKPIRRKLGGMMPPTSELVDIGEAVRFIIA